MKRRLGGWAGALTLVVALVGPLVTAAPANAATVRPLECGLSGPANAGFKWRVDSTGTHVSISATGTCLVEDGLGHQSYRTAWLSGLSPSDPYRRTRMGSCDAHPTTTSLAVLVDAVLEIQGAARHFFPIEWVDYSGIQEAPFPGPAPSIAEVGYGAPTPYLALGEASMFTRIGGRCPPDGTFAATYDLIFY